MRIKIIALIIILLVSKKSTSQENKTEMALYNIGTGGLGAGIGAVINKKKEDKTGKVFLKGFLQGALGGYIVYQSKNRLSKIAQNGRLEYAWEAKILNSAGISIIENAASNINFWERWHFNIGFNRFELYTKEKFRFKYKILPVSFTMTAIASINNSFDWNSSMRTGELIFTNLSLNNVMGFEEVNGYSLGNVTVLNENANDLKSTIAHELIHTYQYYDFNYVNSYFNKTKEDLTKNPFLRKLSKVIYLDTQGAVLRSLYLLENVNRETYFDNFFENEAGFYSGTPNFIIE